MKLFIAEKPSVAKAIAAELGVKSRANGYIDCGQELVTWCFGHMLEQAEPDEYTPDDVPANSKGRKLWRVDELPIIPDEWILHPKDDAKEQLSVIKRLLTKADSVVNAGDPDREGQLLVDEVLEHFGCTKTVERFWVSAQDSISVRRGLDALQSNGKYAGWADAARARQRADWLIGMNFSRAYTLRAQRGGSRTLLTVGRVQTPTLSLVVTRDREIANFRSIPYYTVHAQLAHADGSYSAKWQPGEEQAGLDSEGRLIKQDVADALVTSITGAAGVISDYEQKKKTQAQPRAYSLSDITVLASKRYGYSADDVLTICQSLYEKHKLTSYPRTDCGYLPESQYADAPSVLDALRQVNPDLATSIDGADPSIKSATWNDKKITAHHGIIPTMHQGDRDALNDKERKIYALIVQAYIAQFYPKHEYLQTVISATVADHVFVAKGRQVTLNGWRDVYSADKNMSEDDDGTADGDNADQALPAMEQGDAVTCESAKRRDSKTHPPARFTEGSLVRAMENIHKFVPDSDQKKLLRDGDGIGTSATRASIITELKRRNFLETKGKNLVSTELGRSLIGALPDVVTSPVLTSLYERMLQGIQDGANDLPAFLTKQEKFICDQVAKANDGSLTVAGDKSAVTISKKHKCMSCGAGLIRRKSSKRKGRYWWGCSKYPDCKQTYPDVKGKPNYSTARASKTG